jgi:hypothetical protein
VGINLPALSSALTTFYTNSSAITAFLSTFNTTVTTLMTYPNLLMWTVGNEISLGSSSGLTQSSGTAYSYSGTVSLGWANMWSLVGTLAAIIHALDPYHPVRAPAALRGACARPALTRGAALGPPLLQVGTCTPNINGDVMYNGFMRYANSMDLFGANVYGPAATGFVAKVAGLQGSTGWARPFFASEFGMTNWFNAPYTGPTTSAGASQYATYLEDSSTNKAVTYMTAYQNFIAGASMGAVISPSMGVNQGGFGAQFLGCYAFQYGCVRRCAQRRSAQGCASDPGAQRPALTRADAAACAQLDLAGFRHVG